MNGELRVSITGDLETLSGLPGGSHVCWVVSDQARYADLAAACLAEAGRMSQKSLLFGPHDSVDFADLRPAAMLAADPHIAFLDQRPLEPETMFAMFREHSAIARSEGYSGLRVLADMDWLLPGRPSAEAIIAFEMLLDRVVAELAATVICAYRRSSWDHSTITGALCVHPLRCGHDSQPPFCLVAGDDGRSWRLSGEVDLAASPAFGSAFGATARSRCVVDVADLEFIDIAGMRTIAEAARSAKVGVELRGARQAFQRAWQLAGFGESAPTVALLA